MRRKVIVIFLAVLMTLGIASLSIAEEKHFEGIRIVFFPGGNPGGPFASVVYRGALAAEKDLGCKVEYVWSGWNPDRMIAQFKDAVARRPDAICIMGHPGVAAFAPLVDGVVVVVEARKTSRDDLERCKEMLENFPVLGYVFNKVDNLDSKRYYHQNGHPGKGWFASLKRLISK